MELIPPIPCTRPSLCRSLGTLAEPPGVPCVPSPPPPSHRRHNKQPRLLVSCRLRYCYVCARTRTHARTYHAHADTHAGTLCCGCLTVVSVGKKKPGRGRRGVYFLRERGTEDGAPRAASLAAAAQFCFTSCVHEGSIGEGTTLPGRG